MGVYEIITGITKINKKDYPDDDTHVDLKNTTDRELDAIEICFREKED